VSQKSSQLWIGELNTAKWDFTSQGAIYPFPKDDRGQTIYCNIEGVSWMGADRIVVVSDRKKKDDRDRCRGEDESIHIFDIPGV